MGLKLVVVAQIPENKEFGMKWFKRTLKHFDIYQFFDEIRPSYSTVRRGEADPKDCYFRGTQKE